MTLTPWSRQAQRGPGPASGGANHTALRVLTRSWLVLVCLFLASAARIDLARAQDDTASAQAREETAATVAYSSSITMEEGNTRLVLDFDGKPDYRIFFMDRPMRLVIELDGSSFAFAESGPAGAGLLTDMRYGQISSDKARMVATLSEPAAVRARSLQPIADTDRMRLSIELEPSTAGAYAAMIRNQQNLLGASGQIVHKGARPGVAAENREGRFMIVIDPGHGGIDGGATGSGGTVEKDLVLAISRLLGKQIEAAGPFDVRYTRESDVFVSLNRRRAIARDHDADLLISVHADSLRQSHVRGTTIYTLAKKASDTLAHEIAESENMADVVAGLAAPEEQDVVSNILADLTLRETTIFSRGFSDRLVVRLADRVELINNPQRSASFVVLKNAEIPGVLLELGYLSNNEDEELLTDPAWQEVMALHVAEAVVDFFSPRMAESARGGGAGN